MTAKSYRRVCKDSLKSSNQERTARVAGNDRHPGLQGLATWLLRASPEVASKGQGEILVRCSERKRSPVVYLSACSCPTGRRCKRRSFMSNLGGRHLRAPRFCSYEGCPTRGVPLAGSERRYH